MSGIYEQLDSSNTSRLAVDLHCVSWTILKHVAVHSLLNLLSHVAQPIERPILTSRSSLFPYIINTPHTKRHRLWYLLYSSPISITCPQSFFKVTRTRRRRKTEIRARNKMEASKTIAHEIGGIQNDALRFGLHGVKSDIVGSHPLESAYQSVFILPALYFLSSFIFLFIFCLVPEKI